MAARPGAHGVPRPRARVAAGQSARQRRAANHRRGARRAATGRQEGLRRRARPDGARPQTRHRCASGPSRARVSARLLVAVLCVCCNGTSVTVQSPYSHCVVCHAQSEPSGACSHAMVGKSMCKGNRAIAHIYIRKCRFTKADSDSRFQVSDRHAVIYVYIRKSRFRLQISGFRWRPAPDRRQTDRETD